MTLTSYMGHWLECGILRRDQNHLPNEVQVVLFRHTALCQHNKIIIIKRHIKPISIIVLYEFKMLSQQAKEAHILLLSALQQISF